MRTKGTTQGMTMSPRTKKPNKLNMSHLPSHWQLDPAIKTRSELLENRRRNSLPDISYDLDGDGVVGGQDFLISRRFDPHMQGKLSAEARQQALQFLKEGKDEQFLWGCESSGASRTIPIKQQRGLIIIGDDATKILDTYPSLSVSHNPSVKTQKELKQKRKQRSIDEGSVFKNKIKEDFRKNLHIEDIVDYERYNQNPRFSSQRKATF